MRFQRNKDYERLQGWLIEAFSRTCYNVCTSVEDLENVIANKLDELIQTFHLLVHVEGGKGVIANLAAIADHQNEVVILRIAVKVADKAGEVTYWVEAQSPFSKSIRKPRFG